MAATNRLPMSKREPRIIFSGNRKYGKSESLNNIVKKYRRIRIGEDDFFIWDQYLNSNTSNSYAPIKNIESDSSLEYTED